MKTKTLTTKQLSTIDARIYDEFWNEGLTLFPAHSNTLTVQSSKHREVFVWDDFFNQSKPRRVVGDRAGVWVDNKPEIVGNSKRQPPRMPKGFSRFPKLTRSPSGDNC